jgi:poly(rC)-binding protein 2/3/4
VSFRLLVLDSQVGWLLGNRGSAIKQMSADSGSEIRVSKEKLPLCALLKDELCQVGFFSIEFTRSVPPSFAIFPIFCF